MPDEPAASTNQDSPQKSWPHIFGVIKWDRPTSFLDLDRSSGARQPRETGNGSSRRAEPCCFGPASVQRDYVVCMDCGWKGRSLAASATAHGLTIDEYRARWNLNRIIRSRLQATPSVVPRWQSRSVLGRGRTVSTETVAIPETKTAAQPRPKRPAKPRTKARLRPRRHQKRDLRRMRPEAPRGSISPIRHGGSVCRSRSPPPVLQNQCGGDLPSARWVDLGTLQSGFQ